MVEGICVRIYASSRLFSSSSRRISSSKLAILQQGSEFLFDLCLGLGTDDLVNHLTVLEEEDGGDVTDAELSSQIIILLYIALADHDLTVVGACQFS